METQKNAHFNRLYVGSQNLSEKISYQFTSIEELMKGKRDPEQYQIIEENEKSIDQLETLIRADFSSYILLHTPRAKDLRKAITYQDVTNYLEHIGDLLLQTSFFLRKFDYSSDIFSDLLLTLEKLFIYAKELVSNALYSLYSEDKVVAYRMIAQYTEIGNLSEELTNSILTDFQGIELEESELNNILIIDSMNLLIYEIARAGSSIAEAIVYLIDGVNIRHRIEDLE